MKAITIGRDEQCDIVIHDNSNVISRRHAVLNIDNNGRMTITDLSSNGTYINGIRIVENSPVPINRKDVVSFAHIYDLDWKLVPITCKLSKKFILSFAFGIILCVALVWWGVRLFNDQNQSRVDVKLQDTILNINMKEETIPEQKKVDSLKNDSLKNDSLKVLPKQQTNNQKRKQQKEKKESENPSTKETDSIKKENKKADPIFL